jgi:hypothetical protein
MPVLSGKSHWATISSPNTTYEPVYSIDLALTGAELDKAKNLGLIIKNKGDDRGDFVSIKRKQYRRDGSENTKPALKDAQKRDMGNVLIGNGSDVNVLFKTYEWEYAGKSGVGTDLQAVQVVNLIPYGADEDFDVVPSGYTASEDAFSDDIPFGTSVAS